MCLKREREREEGREKTKFHMVVVNFARDCICTNVLLSFVDKFNSEKVQDSEKIEGLKKRRGLLRSRTIEREKSIRAWLRKLCFAMNQETDKSKVTSHTCSYIHIDSYTSSEKIYPRV